MKNAPHSCKAVRGINFFKKKSDSKNKKQAAALRPVVIFGDPLEIRTPDPLLKRQLLCQLS